MLIRKGSTHGLSITTVQARPADHQDIIYLRFTELLSFLQGYQDKGPKLHFVCPWGGVPPSIEIQFETALESSATIELSFRLCDALLQYISA